MVRKEMLPRMAMKSSYLVIVATTSIRAMSWFDDNMDGDAGDYGEDEFLTTNNSNDIN
jgi:hypothetical protein